MDFILNAIFATVMQLKDQPMVNWYLLRKKNLLRKKSLSIGISYGKKNQTPKLQAKGQIGNGMQKCHEKQKGNGICSNFWHGSGV